jgi:hypothetical protein
LKKALGDFSKDDVRKALADQATLLYAIDKRVK